MCFIRSNIAYPNINVDAVDFGECHSKEVKFLLMRSAVMNNFRTQILSNNILDFNCYCCIMYCVHVLDSVWVFSVQRAKISENIGFRQNSQCF